MKSAHKINIKLAFLASLLLFTKAMAESSIDENLTCIGTEPFWSLVLETSVEQLDRVVYRLEFSIAGDENSNVAFGPYDLTTQTSLNRPSIFTTHNVDSDFEVIVERKDQFDTECNDGMSDRLYPYSAQILTGGKLYSGCCQSNIYPAHDDARP